MVRLSNSKHTHSLLQLRWRGQRTAAGKVFSAFGVSFLDYWCTLLWKHLGNSCGTVHNFSVVPRMTSITRTVRFYSIYYSSLEKLFLYKKATNNFSTNFVPRLSKKRSLHSSLNFHSIFAVIRNRHTNLLSVVTQPRRQLGAILWFHVIINIFITIHHKLTIFSTHEPLIMGQHTDTLMSVCASK